MERRNISAWLRRPSPIGAIVTALVGLTLWGVLPGGVFERISFDVPTVFGGAAGFPELVLVELDESSHRELQQDYGKVWNRRLHARLVDHLRSEGARLVVFDVEFHEMGGDTQATTELAAALRTHGNVVLGASLEHIGRPGFGGTKVLPPVRDLLVPGVSWGVSWSLPGPKGEEDGVVRFHPGGRDPDAPLPWVAAVAAGAAIRKGGARPGEERWVRHYGPPGTLPRVSYWQATNQAPGFYRGKAVFIGGRPGTGFVRQEGDQFRTPWSRNDGSLVSGLELTATAWLNLVRGDWLTRTPRTTELVALLVFGLLLGGVLMGGPAWRAVLIGLLAVAVVFGAALWLFFARNLWCDWAVVVLAQVPVAFAWRAVARYRKLHQEKAWLEAPLHDLFPGPAPTPGAHPVPATTTSSPRTATPGGSAGAPPIPDYEMLRCVGRGGYGEVWLARDLLGGFRAVKVVRRVAFDDDGPYEREFRGLQKFAPVSRRHPGLVPVLHVGLQREGGFFYYVMEVGDDETTGVRIEPERYVPRSLGRDLRMRGGLPAREVATLGIALCDALGFLHDQGLIHRDLKPANVIFIAGQPRLADVGLVTDIASRGGGVTQVGTEGFIPPEGVGTAAGDIFALGQLLETAWKGLTAEPGPASDALAEILGKARAEEAGQRHASAGALREALLQWRLAHSPAAEGLDQKN